MSDTTTIVPRFTVTRSPDERRRAWRSSEDSFGAGCPTMTGCTNASKHGAFPCVLVSAVASVKGSSARALKADRTAAQRAMCRA